MTVIYPFRSKKPPPGVPTKALLHDNKKPKKLTRPCFSQNMGCWIFDFVFNLGRKNDRFLFMMNMNTRYLVAKHTSNKGAEAVRHCLGVLRERLEDLLENVKLPNGEKPVRISCIMGDGERAFLGIEEEVRRMAGKVKVIINSSPYTYHGKILDRCVRTIRDGIGYAAAKSKEEVYQIVEYYNNTYHNGIDCTPLEMMLHPEWEWQYIRYCQEKVNYVNRYRQRTGLFSYRKGNILFLHVEHSKTREKFEKQRRYWNRVAVFLGYDSGNVRAQTWVKNKDKVFEVATITVPIYFTKCVAPSLDQLSKLIIETYNLVGVRWKSLEH
jgi:hypothetical protein